MIIIRTNRWDVQNEIVASYYKSSGFRVVAVVDETAGTVDTGNTDKISITKEWMDRHRLPYNFPGALWRCGDYFYYAAIDKYPDEQFYCMVEDDALLASSDLRCDLQLAAESEFDIVCAQYSKRSSKWIWYKSIKPFTDEVFGCLFPITIIKNAMLLKLFELRREMAASLIKNAAAMETDWPGDEAFVVNFGRSLGKVGGFNQIHPGSEDEYFNSTSSGMRYISDIFAATKRDFQLIHPFFLEYKESSLTLRLAGSYLRRHEISSAESYLIEADNIISHNKIAFIKISGRYKDLVARYNRARIPSEEES